MTLEELEEKREQAWRAYEKEKRKWKKNRSLEKMEQHRREAWDIWIQMNIIKDSMPPQIARIYKKRTLRSEFGPSINLYTKLKELKEKKAPTRKVEYLEFIIEKEKRELDEWMLWGMKNCPLTQKWIKKIKEEN